MKPENFLKKMQHKMKAMEQAKKQHVAVGVLESSSSSAVYDDGLSVVQIAAIHELGLGSTPERSFLKMPQTVKSDNINVFINAEFTKILNGSSVDAGLGRIGVFAYNITQEAFDSNGFGNWDSLSEYTIQAKGSGKTLVDTGTLRQSISWEVRGGAS